MATLVDSALGFVINLAIVTVIVRFIYYPSRRDKDYVFTFFAFNTVIFFVMRLLSNTGLSVGVGFGLFAIFTVLRYRTITVPIREMTYLFVIIALPVLNSLLLQERNYAEFAVANIATVGVLYLLEQGWGFDYESRKSIVYERIEMIRPENWPLLLADLQQRTGLPIQRVEIGRLNFLRDSAELTVYYNSRALDTREVSFASNHIIPSDKDSFDG